MNLGLIRRAALMLTIASVAVFMASCASTKTDVTTTPPAAEAVIKDAVKKARAENKNVLVEFEASWCKWCKRFNSALQSTELRDVFEENYVIVRLVAEESDDKKALEHPGATEMMKNESGDGIPFYMFLDKSGAKIADSMAMPEHKNIGYPAAPEEIQAFGELIRKTAPRVTAAQHDMIASYLEKNAP